MILSEPPAQHSLATFRVVLLSGLSDPSTCALSPTQRRFLDAIDVPNDAKIYWNFPYIPSSRERRNPPLWLASVRNTRQFFDAARPEYRKHWRALVDATGSLVVITGSCGLEILNHCSDERDPIEHVIALGPVARSRPRAPHTLVQGTRDPFSKFFFRRCDVELPGVGHMNYLEDERVLRLVNDLCSNTSRFSAAASISRSAS